MELGVDDLLIQLKKYFLSADFMPSAGDGTGLTQTPSSGSFGQWLVPTPFLTLQALGDGNCGRQSCEVPKISAPGVQAHTSPSSQM